MVDLAEKVLTICFTRTWRPRPERGDSRWPGSPDAELRHLRQRVDYVRSSAGQRKAFGRTSRGPVRGTNAAHSGYHLVSRTSAMLSRTKTTSKPADDRPRPEPPSVSPPTLPPDFPVIPQNPELQPPPDPGATPDKVAGTTPELPQPETQEAMRKSELRYKNARLRQTINSVLEQHSELRDATEIAMKQGSPMRGGTPFLERIQANLQERARAIIERRPDLEHLFDD